jgi:hypothetical protein
MDNKKDKKIYQYLHAKVAHHVLWRYHSDHDLPILLRRRTALHVRIMWRNYGNSNGEKKHTTEKRKKCKKKKKPGENRTGYTLYSLSAGKKLTVSSESS